MKYGIREICDVVFRAKATMKVGNKVFYKDEPVIYFDSLKTSTLEGAATTVYAQGGKGNARLMAWEGERTVTFTMEDALISTVGLSILTGADVVEYNKDSDNKMIVHASEIIEVNTEGKIKPTETPAAGATNEHVIYVMELDNNGNVISEPYIGTYEGDEIVIKAFGTYTTAKTFEPKAKVLVDYYVEKLGTQVSVKADSFGGNFYIEASTLFRGTDGVDKPAEFVIPNGKIQSNFTFNMASSGDPSTFTFTIDAFPDYTRWNSKDKVFSDILIIDEDAELNKYGEVRTETAAKEKSED